MYKELFENLFDTKVVRQMGWSFNVDDNFKNITGVRAKDFNCFAINVYKEYGAVSFNVYQDRVYGVDESIQMELLYQKALFHMWDLMFLYYDMNCDMKANLDDKHDSIRTAYLHK